MHHINIEGSHREFEILLTADEAQAAMMILRPGASSDEEPSNEHPDSQQWLLVLSGSGHALVGKNRQGLRRVPLRKDSLLVIEKGELHQIQNTSTVPMRTINFYVPPAYDADGNPIAKAEK
jgi:mannose-6-phosphate isomerase-like protein (cupin superfamily)